MADITEQDRQAAREIETRAMDCCIDLPCRRLKVYIAEALATARAEGRKAGIEQAAQIANGFEGCHEGESTATEFAFDAACQHIEAKIRALLDA